MTILEQWNCYVEHVYGNAELIPEHQLRETRRAFYAGTAGMIALMNKASEYEDIVAVAIIEDLHKELAEFSADVSIGRK